jgi:hypothetical protein
MRLLVEIARHDRERFALLGFLFLRRLGHPDLLCRPWLSGSVKFDLKQRKMDENRARRAFYSVSDS